MEQGVYPSYTHKKKVTELEKVVVTGSLIPQSEIETNTPVVIITAEDIQARAFANVHDVLQSSSFATGRVQNQSDFASVSRL